MILEILLSITALVFLFWIVVIIIDLISGYGFPYWDELLCIFVNSLLWPMWLLIWLFACCCWLASKIGGEDDI